MSMSPRRAIVNADVLRLRWVDEPRLGAGGRLAYCVTSLDATRDAQVTAVAVGGRRFEGHSPRWSPRGDRLAYASAATLMTWAGGEPSLLARAGAPVTQPRWSPNGGRLAYVAGGRLWVADATTGVSLPLAGDLSADLPVWISEDELAFVSAASDGASADVWTIGAGGDAAPRRRFAFGGPIRALAASPSGADLGFIGHDRGFAQGVNQQVWVLSLATGEARPLTARFDRSAGLATRGDDLRGMNPPELVWDRDGEASRIYFIYAEGGSSRLAWCDLTGRVTTIGAGPRAALSFDIADGALAAVVSSPVDPGEVWLSDRDGAGGRPVTTENAAWLGEVKVSPPALLSVVANDGQPIEAWLVAPPELSLGARAPLLLEIHGGPHYPIGNRFYFEFQRLAAQGYAVVFSNPRGSQGYGEAFATCIRGAWGGRDYADVMSVLDAALAAPAVDPSRVGVTGVSYGAYMTHLMLGRTQRFRAAVTENGISDLVSNYGSTQNQRFWDWQLFGPPEDEPERYRALSPLTYADAIETPLLLIHAEQDSNCPIGQSEQMRAALAARGVPAELVRIPGEGHMMNLIGAPSSRARRAAALDAWLGRWLAGSTGGRI